MQRNLSLPLASSLMMLPHLVETIYSPALPYIADKFTVTAASAGQTLSIYFVAFALGIVVWGRLCDQTGRRPALLWGLTLYGTATLLTTWCHNITELLFLRAIAAFGIAAASIVTQTALRDQNKPAQLSRLFGIIGIAMALSPIVGVTSGAWLVKQAGFSAVLHTLTIIALGQWIYVALCMPETQPRHSSPPSNLNDALHYAK